jgi:hypothetical protein
MPTLRRLAASAVFSLLFFAALPGFAQTDIEKQLASQFAMTKATADRTDIVTAGSVLVLQKDGLIMDTATSRAPMPNVYRDGNLSSTAAAVAKRQSWMKYVPGASSIPGAGSIPTVDTRKFVTGEKFWVTKITVQEDGVVFELFSDPILNLRYYSTLKFPFPKGSPPPADKMLSTIGEVLKVQPDDAADAKQGASTSGGAAAGPPASSNASAAPPAAPAGAASPAPGAAMAPIAPPPPPPDAPPAQPPAIAIGQTKDQVVALFGQPKHIANLGTKEIDYYSDMKVTFIKGKVSDIQ